MADRPVPDAPKGLNSPQEVERPAGEAAKGTEIKIEEKKEDKKEDKKEGKK
ncbi:hypothetical protein IG631_15828 [Alternaria alternata]|nr:hypothetical protein IG631_15828 [Alternaria alternata]